MVIKLSKNLLRKPYRNRPTDKKPATMSANKKPVVIKPPRQFEPVQKDRPISKQKPVHKFNKTHNFNKKARKFGKRPRKFNKNNYRVQKIRPIICEVQFVNSKSITESEFRLYSKRYAFKLLVKARRGSYVLIHNQNKTNDRVDDLALGVITFIYPTPTNYSRTLHPTAAIKRATTQTFKHPTYPTKGDQAYCSLVKRDRDFDNVWEFYQRMCEKMSDHG